MQTETRIIRVEKDFIVCFKESNLDTVPLKREREKPSLLSFASSLYPEVLKVEGKNSWEAGVLHRLDRPTSGLVLIARNQKFYDKMIDEQDKGLFIKHYRAKTEPLGSQLEGFPPISYDLNCDNVIRSKFRSYGKGAKSVRPLIKGQYLYEKTNPVYETIIDSYNDFEFYLTLNKGFRHQIRCHLCWLLHPIVGDTLYGASPSSSFGLLSHSIEFLGERVDLYS